MVTWKTEVFNRTVVKVIYADNRTNMYAVEYVHIYRQLTQLYTHNSMCKSRYVHMHLVLQSQHKINSSSRMDLHDYDILD